ncbi:MAG: NDP-sugar synthase [Acidobacteria bacterium]|nr:NDP-sugar synthase [Acidobacteriota bacterium]
MQAIILAGGKGTRLRPLTLSIPKPITTIANRPFLYYQLEMLKKAGVEEVILGLSYQPEKIMEVFGNGEKLGIKIRYLVEPEPLGTAGAYKFAESLINRTTIVFNGDILTNIDMAMAVKLHRERNATATIILVPVENPSAYGLVETSTDGKVLRFLEKPKANEITCNTINAGMYVLEPKALSYIPRSQEHSFEYQLFPRLLKEKEPFYSIISKDYWLDIGTNSRYLQANLDVIANKLSLEITRTRLAAWQSAHIDDLSLVDETVNLETNVEITNSVIGANCAIEREAKIKDSVILPNTKIKANVIIEKSIIGENCLIKESSTILKGSVLGNNTSISDFSQIGLEL